MYNIHYLKEGDSVLPEWVQQYKTPGTTVKKIGNNYYLYYATSRRVPGKAYPVSVQAYIGKITENGVVSDRVSINVGQTQACLLSELVPGLPDDMGKLVVLQAKGSWLYTKMETGMMGRLKEKGIYDNGKVVFQHI